MRVGPGSNVGAMCQCGCGLPAPIASRSLKKEGWVRGEPRPFRQGHNAKHRALATGYRTVYRPNHPRANKGRIHLHRLIAEAALGRPLPLGAQVHHVDGDSLNNANSNLVICQDGAYHKLLHTRARILRAGGDPNTQRQCCMCRQLKPFAAFPRQTKSVNDGLSARCRCCGRSYRESRRLTKEKQCA